MTVGILVVDDEPDVSELFRQRFRREIRQGSGAIGGSPPIDLLMQTGLWKGRIMRKAMPTRWIEQAELRQVLTIILSERKPTPRPGRVGADAASHLSTRLLLWLTIQLPVGWSN